MAEPDEIEEDLFADLYEGDEDDNKPTEQSSAAPPNANINAVNKPSTTSESVANSIEPNNYSSSNQQANDGNEPAVYGENIYGDDNAGAANGQGGDSSAQVVNEHGFSGTVGIKEDGYKYNGSATVEVKL